MLIKERLMITLQRKKLDTSTIMSKGDRRTKLKISGNKGELSLLTTRILSYKRFRGRFWVRNRRIKNFVFFLQNSKNLQWLSHWNWNTIDLSFCLFASLMFVDLYSLTSWINSTFIVSYFPMHSEYTHFNRCLCFIKLSWNLGFSSMSGS